MRKLLGLVRQSLAGRASQQLAAIFVVAGLAGACATVPALADIGVPTAFGFGQDNKTSFNYPTANSCSSHMLKIPFTGEFTVARRAGHAVTATVTLRSATRVALPRVFFDYELEPPTSHRRPTPAMSWRLGHRKWRPLPLPFWTPASSKTNAFWESNDVRIGSIARHSRHSLQMRITFHKRDRSGLYDGQIAFGSSACGHGQMIIGFGEINFAYQP